MEKTNNIFVIDINFLLPEEKDEKPENLLKYFEDKYMCNVLLVDSSKQNTQGSSGAHSATYFYVNK